MSTFLPPQLPPDQVEAYGFDLSCHCWCESRNRLIVYQSQLPDSAGQYLCHFFLFCCHFLCNTGVRGMCYIWLGKSVPLAVQLLTEVITELRTRASHLCKLCFVKDVCSYHLKVQALPSNANSPHHHCCWAMRSVSWTWWHIPAIPTLQRLRQEDLKSKVGLGDIS